MVSTEKASNKQAPVPYLKEAVDSSIDITKPITAVMPAYPSAWTGLVLGVCHEGTGGGRNPATFINPWQNTKDAFFELDVSAHDFKAGDVIQVFAIMTNADHGNHVPDSLKYTCVSGS